MSHSAGANKIQYISFSDPGEGKDLHIKECIRSKVSTFPMTKEDF